MTKQSIGKMEFSINNSKVHTTLEPTEVGEECQWEYSFNAPTEIGEYVASARFIPLLKYTGSNSNKYYFSVYKLSTEISLLVDDDDDLYQTIDVDDKITVSGDVVDETVVSAGVFRPVANGNVTVKNNQYDLGSTTTDNNGDYALANKQLVKGIHTLQSIYSPATGDAGHISSVSNKIKVFVSDSDLTTPSFTLEGTYGYGSILSYDIETEYNIDRVKIYIYNNDYVTPSKLEEYYIVDLEEDEEEEDTYVGHLDVPIYNSGTYHAYLEYEGSNNYNPVYVSKDITVVKKDVAMTCKWLPLAVGSVLEVPDYIYMDNLDRGITMEINIGEDLSPNPSFDNQGNAIAPVKRCPLVIYDNGEAVATVKTDNFGEVKWLFKPTYIGVHKFCVRFSGDTFYNPGHTPPASEGADYSIEIEVIDAHTQITRTNGNIQRFSRDGVRLTDTHGNGLPNRSLIYSVHTIDYTIVTDEDGYANLPIHLNVGTYPVVVTYKGEGAYERCQLKYNLVVKEPSVVWKKPQTIVSSPATRVYDDNFKQIWYDTSLGEAGDNNFAICGKITTNNSETIGPITRSYYDQWNIPADLLLTNFGFNIPTNASVQSIICRWADRQVNARTESSPYPNIGNATVKVLGTGDMSWLDVRTAEEPPLQASRGLATHEIKWVWTEDLDVIHETDFGVKLSHGINNSNEHGSLWLKYFEMGVVYSLPNPIIDSMEFRGEKYNALLNKFTITYNAGNTVDVYLEDTDEEPAANQEVVISINSVDYVRVTDDEGVASLPIMLLRGNYVVKAEYGGKLLYADVEVV